MSIYRPEFRWLSPLLLILCIFSAIAEPLHAAAPIRGITLSTHRSGEDWGWDSIEPTLDRINELGATWVAIHPYAWITDDGTVHFREFDSDNPPASIIRPIVEAHRRGLKILIKPHLGYWRSRFSWRGEINFDSEDEWNRFFRTYETWITQVAALSREADGFCVGTELDATLDHESEWRRVIASVRELTPAPLSYAANWATYRRVSFWDAVDIIGVQAYFPLTEARDPDEEELRAGWASVMSEIEDFAAKRDQYVVFTELGYNQSHQAAARPWDSHSDEEDAAAELQARCLRVALELIEEEPRVIGAFLWKWFPEPHPVGRNFQLAAPHMLEVIRSVWVPNAGSR
jgi:sugar phosphate isomerase/epimerase